MMGQLKYCPQPSDLVVKIRRVSSRQGRSLGAKIRRLVDKAYYRTLFGLKLPRAPVVARKLAALENRQGKGDVPVAPEIWDSQYRDGQWGFLEELEQMPRYSVIAGYFQLLKCGGSLLDIGCGQGILRERLGASDYSRYVGIDVSQTAVELARRKPNARSVFSQADAHDFTPTENFDAIIFNEVLYYFPDPLAVAQRYRAWLCPGGVFITSLYAGSDRARATGRLLKRAFPLIDEVKVSTSNANTWLISVFSPTRADLKT
jgi:2-polyprenyl-3-methyl-5-hydroxy-6-metoxy-1,4-benzoquinol methylase